MRFLADMGIANRVVEWLHAQGHDITHLREEGLQCASDKEVFQKAVAEKRILLTFDLDFGEIVALSERHVLSIILFRLHNTRTPHVIERLAKVLNDASKALEKGAIIVVEESRYRVRSLPFTGRGKP
jgi:predicted nuclease of predicted toxin-antitoxin system